MELPDTNQFGANNDTSPYTDMYSRNQYGLQCSLNSV